ncbi:transposase [Citrobacter gillenii]|uniref:Transposase n=1 Tax=Citrobacter gillenii TaxID=67828 RepID=A0ABD6M4C3_9ENTR|nr:transposase [Citrobacter gillenii]
MKAIVLTSTGALAIKVAKKSIVAPGSILSIDEHTSYEGMLKYTHMPVNYSAKQFVDGMTHNNNFESV